MRIAGHHGGQRAERHVDCRVAHGGAQVVGYKDVHELQSLRGLRDREQGDRRDNVRQRHPHQPGTRAAPARTGLADDDTHDDIRASVKKTGDQHDQTNCYKRNADIVRVKQGQQGIDHTIDDVTRTICQAVADAGYPRDLDESAPLCSSRSARAQLRFC